MCRFKDLERLYQPRDRVSLKGRHRKQALYCSYRPLSIIRSQYSVLVVKSVKCYFDVNP
jgi:hypothetical protein